MGDGCWTLYSAEGVALARAFVANPTDPVTVEYIGQPTAAEIAYLEKSLEELSLRLKGRLIERDGFEAVAEAGRVIAAQDGESHG